MWIVLFFFRKKTTKIRIHQNLLVVFLLSFLTLKIPLWFVPGLQGKSTVSDIENIFYKPTSTLILSIASIILGQYYISLFQAGCLVVSLSSYFFTLCTLSWMMVEGINIAILVVFVFQHHKNKLFKLYLFIGYGELTPSKNFFIVKNPLFLVWLSYPQLN